MRTIWSVGALAGLATALQTGCVGTFLSLFDEQFLNVFGLGNTGAAVLPGEAPALEVRFDNRTAQVAEMQVSYRSGTSNVRSINVTLQPDSTPRGEALVCPIDEITLGDVTDVDAVGAIIRLGTGTANDPFVEVEPLGVILKDDGVNYTCGDSLTFVVDESTATSSGFQVFALIQRASTPTANSNSGS